MVNSRESLDLTTFAAAAGSEVEWRISDSLVDYVEAIAVMEARVAGVRHVDLEGNVRADLPRVPGGAVDGGRQKLWPDISLSAIRGRTLRRGRICRIRTVGKLEIISNPGGHEDFRRRTAQGRR